MAAKQRGLGKGLDLIFAENDTEAGNAAIELKVSDLEPNRSQPRRKFDEASLAELADSIAKHGVLQPLLVRPLFGGGYQIVAGERRWRAARMAGVQTVPAMVRDLNDQQVTELALIENLQREDLNPMEEAQGFDTLLREHGMTQEEISESVGKSRPAIANALRLLHLPDEVRALLEDGSFRPGRDGRCLPSQRKCRCPGKAHGARRPNGAAARKARAAGKCPAAGSLKKDNPFFEEAALSLHEQLGRRVMVTGTKKKGTLQIIDIRIERT